MLRGTFPTRLIGPIVAEAIDRNNVIDVHELSHVGEPMGGVDQVSRLTGVGQRRLLTIRKQEQANIEFDTADRIIIGLDLWHLASTEVADGGLKEYFDGTMEPDPETPRQTYIRLKDNARRYARKHGVFWGDMIINTRHEETPEQQAALAARRKRRKREVERKRLWMIKQRAALACA